MKSFIVVFFSGRTVEYNSLDTLKEELQDQDYWVYMGGPLMVNPPDDSYTGVVISAKDGQWVGVIASTN